MLTTSPGTWTGSPTLLYFWQRCDAAATNCNPILGANAQTYNVVAADVGSTIGMRIRATNSAGALRRRRDPGRARHAARRRLRPRPASALGARQLSSSPSIAGTTNVGQTLAASPGSWSGLPAPALAYAWQRCASTGASCATVAGATAQTYALGSSDAGSKIAVKVTASNTAGTVAATSVAVGPVATVATSSAPVNSVLPKVSGSTTVGQPLDGFDRDVDGQPAPTYCLSLEALQSAGR